VLTVGLSIWIFQPSWSSFQPGVERLGYAPAYVETVFAPTNRLRQLAKTPATHPAVMVYDHRPNQGGSFDPATSTQQADKGARKHVCHWARSRCRTARRNLRRTYSPGGPIFQHGGCESFVNAIRDAMGRRTVRSDGCGIVRTSDWPSPAFPCKR
jgi:hypothetical protein